MKNSFWGKTKWLIQAGLKILIAVAALVDSALLGIEINAMVSKQRVEQNGGSNANAQENNGTLKNHTQTIDVNNGTAINGDIEELNLINPPKPVRQLENETEIKKQIDNALNDYSNKGYSKQQVQVEVKHVQGDEEGSQFTDQIISYLQAKNYAAYKGSLNGEFSGYQVGGSIGGYTGYGTAPTIEGNSNMVRFPIYIGRNNKN